MATPSPSVAALKERLAAVKADMYRSTLAQHEGHRRAASNAGEREMSSSPSANGGGGFGDGITSVRTISPPRAKSPTGGRTEAALKSSLANRSRLFASSSPTPQPSQSSPRPQHREEGRTPLQKLAESSPKGQHSNHTTPRSSQRVGTRPHISEESDHVTRLLVATATSPMMPIEDELRTREELLQRAREGDQAKADAISAIVQMEQMLNDQRLELTRANDIIAKLEYERDEQQNRIDVLERDCEQATDKASRLQRELDDSAAVAKARIANAERQLEESMKELEDAINTAQQHAQECERLRAENEALRNGKSVTNGSPTSNALPHSPEQQSSPRVTDGSPRKVKIATQVKSDPVASSRDDGSRMERVERAVYSMQQQSEADREERKKMLEGLQQLQRSVSEVTSTVCRLVAANPPHLQGTSSHPASRSASTGTGLETPIRAALVSPRPPFV